MKNFVFLLKQLLFKNSCIICGNILKDTNYLCNNCYNDFKYVSSIKNKGRVYYIWDYDERFRKLIFSMKFKGLKKISKIFKSLIEEKLEYILEKEEINLIIPVPVHKKRFLERGFNQVEEILNDLEIPYKKIERKKNTDHMYKFLSESERKANISGSFKILKKDEIEGKNILIFDDIITTGSTTEEIEKILKEANARKICIFSLAAGKYFKKNKNI